MYGVKLARHIITAQYGKWIKDYENINIPTRTRRLYIRYQYNVKYLEALSFFYDAVRDQYCYVLYYQSHQLRPGRFQLQRSCVCYYIWPIYYIERME